MYTGCRNGSVKRFDLRVKDPEQDVLANKYQIAKAPINYIKTAGEWLMIVNTKYGDVRCLLNLLVPGR